PDKFHFLGIDIGGACLRLAISNNNLEIIYKKEFQMNDISDDEDKSFMLVHKIDQFLEHWNMERNTISAIGIGVTGIINEHSNTILNIPNRLGCDNVNTVDNLSETYGCPVYLEEGGRTMTLAEMKVC